jgi:hypothetical protein
MMGYKEWFEDHKQKHKKIMEKLSHLSDDEMIEYFQFNNMVKNEPDFCPLYKDNKQCHEIEGLEEVNCYLCACPNFRVASKNSHCDIDCKYGSYIVADDNFIHQDCTRCYVPHTISYVKKHFDRDWGKIMSKTFLEDA